jgi:nucleotide-binding universal stress UspA family protein
MKILAAVDGSTYTKRMLAYLSAHDEWLGAAHTYTLLHAVPAIPPRAAAVMNRADLQAYYDETAEKVFKPIRSFLSKRQIAANYVSKVGSAADMVVQAAQKSSPDLIIMGSHGHGSFKNLVMGSVATKVLAQCSVPVLLIR